MRAVRPATLIGVLREQARHRSVVDFEAGRRALAEQEAFLEYKDWITVGVDDQPVNPDWWGFHNNWFNAELDPEWELYADIPRNPASYFRDRWGFVHLRGVVDNPTHTPNYILAVPDDLAPMKNEYFVSSYKTTTPKAVTEFIPDLGTTLLTYGCLVVVGAFGGSASGAVEVSIYFENTNGPVRTLQLDGISWRAHNAGEPRPID